MRVTGNQATLRVDILGATFGYLNTTHHCFFHRKKNLILSITFIAPIIIGWKIPTDLGSNYWINSREGSLALIVKNWFWSCMSVNKTINNISSKASIINFILLSENYFSAKFPQCVFFLRVIQKWAILWNF